jgi:hypothetical protein
VTLAFAPLTAYALDSFFKRKRSVPWWLLPLSALLLVLRAGQELYRWKHNLFVAGWRSGFDLLATLVIFCAGMYAFRAAEGRKKAWLGVLLVLFIGADYKAFGTSKRFNANASEVDRYSSVSLRGMEDGVYQRLRSDTGYRVIVDNDTGPDPNNLRHIGLVTPQGFDPLLTIQLRKLVNAHGTFRTDRLFEINLEDQTAMRLFGVRYVISSEYSKQFPMLKDNPRYRLVGSFPTFYRVYEYLDARPAFSWEGTNGAEVTRLTWEPETRKFHVRAAAGGKLALHEQFFPGWTSFVDGKSAAVEPWGGAFQAVDVPAGEHTVEFRYRPRLLWVGAGISLASLIGLAFWMRASSRNTSDTGYRAVSE